MSDLLVIVGPDEDDHVLVEQLPHARPGRVTVLVEDGCLRGPDWALDDSPAGSQLRDRLAKLLYEIETRTGATVVGTVGDLDQLAGWRFDRVVRARAGRATAAPTAVAA